VALDHGGRIERTERIGVVDIRQSRSGDINLEPVDGQPWRRADSTHLPWSRRRLPTGYTATISNRAFGSYFIRLDNGGRRFRAERIQ